MVKIIGHRGARGLAVENTLASITEALKYKVNEIEIDVRITKDGVPVLSHNQTFVVQSTPYQIRNYTHAELLRCNPTVTTLEEAITAVVPYCILRIEIKPGEPVLPVVKAIGVSGTADNVIIGSKSQKVLREAHKLLPEIPLVVIEPWSGIRASWRAKEVGTKLISMRSWWLWRGFLRSMYNRGYLIAPYTMNNPTKVARWEPYIYAVVTDFPDRFAPSSSKLE